MGGKCTRIEKIEIENFKNVKYGQVVLKNNALFKDLVDVCKNAIVILTISTVKINRHW